MVLLIYLYIFFVVATTSVTLLFLLARIVCVFMCVWYGELFSGIPNEDEEGGWIQAASVSGPEGHPAVPWRR